MNTNYESSDGFVVGNGQDELDFPFPLFYGQTASEIPRDDHDDLDAPSNLDSDPSSSCADPSQAYSVLSLSQSYHHVSSEDLLPCPHSDMRDLLGHSLSSHMGAASSASPRIEITCSELHHHHHLLCDHVHTQPVDINLRLTVPPYQNPIYRENLSPASSTSSTSWHSEVYSPQPSPCVSPSNSSGMAAISVNDLCPRLQAIQAGSPHTSPTTSPRTSITEETFLNCRPSSRPSSRSTSPKGKRTYEQYQNPVLVGQRSRSPSPHTRQEEPPEVSPANLEEFVESLSRNLAKPVPTKIVRPNQEYSGVVFPSAQEVKKETVMEPVYVMSTLSWPSQLPAGMCSVASSSLPALDWALPRSADQCELRIEVQPRQHHRAHYETEGSRGAVKAPSGGHPVVQLHGYQGREILALQVYIGTAEERAVRPHAFYQVHRITGKTVTTTSYERMVDGTKVLELPLEPKDNMRAVVDCVGILKLKNADIELRKGETDVGRKNTRVRLVFRVHMPQPGGQWLSLQAASHPIECSQRSALEHPAVERQDVDRCSVLGGLPMILTGQNFTSDSRVLFTEKTQDGLEVWEAEAKVDRERSQASMLYVEIPPYRDASIYHPAKVNFCVLNGKRKRSQPQHFTYIPLTVPLIKAEPADEYQYGQMSQVYSMSPQSCHHTPHLNAVGCALGASVAPRTGPTMYAPVSEYHIAHPAALYQSPVETLNTSSGLYQPPLDPPVSVIQAGCSPGRVSSKGPHPGSHLKPGSYQHAAAPGHGYEAVVAAAAAMYSGLDVPEFGPVVSPQRAFVQRASPTPGRSPPGHSYAPQQPCTSVEHQRTSSPGRVAIKQENLDQAYLDDVNEVIRKDLTVHTSEQ